MSSHKSLGTMVLGGTAVLGVTAFAAANPFTRWIHPGLLEGR